MDTANKKYTPRYIAGWIVGFAVAFLAVTVLFKNVMGGGDLKDVIEKEAAAAKAQTPINISQGMDITDVYIEDGYFVYVYSCDEAFFDLDVINANIDTNREAVKHELQNSEDESLKAFIQQLKTLQMGMKYIYTGLTSGKTCSFTIEHDEL